MPEERLYVPPPPPPAKPEQARETVDPDMAVDAERPTEAGDPDAQPI